MTRIQQEKRHLLNNNVNPLHVKQVSCHKKLESLVLYNVAPIKQQNLMSRVISIGEENGKSRFLETETYTKATNYVHSCESQQHKFGKCHIAI